MMSFILKRLSISPLVTCTRLFAIEDWTIKYSEYISCKSIFLCQSSGADLEGGGVGWSRQPPGIFKIYISENIIRDIFVCIFQNVPSLVARSLLYLNRMKVHLCFDVNSKLAIGILFFIISMQNNNNNKLYMYVWHVRGSVGNKSDSYFTKKRKFKLHILFFANIFEHVLSTN